MTETFITDSDTIDLKELYIVKYNPTKLDDIVGNEDIVRLFKYYLRTRDFPNMILVGPSGCGKMPLTQAFVREFLGPHFSTHCLEIYGSLNRGKCIVNTTVDANKSVDKYIPNISTFLKKTLVAKDVKRIVVIYDFDYITTDTQMALRRVMEENDNVKFVLPCNSRDNISESIQSRANIYSLSRIDDASIQKILLSIVERERLSVKKEVLDCIVKYSENNIKVAINCLQLISNIESISLDQFNLIINSPASFQIEHFIRACINRDEQTALDIVNSLINSGYSFVDLLNLMLKTVIDIKLEYIAEKHQIETKARIIEIISDFFLINETSLTITNMYCLVYRLLTIRGGGHLGGQLSP